MTPPPLDLRPKLAQRSPLAVAFLTLVAGLVACLAFDPSSLETQSLLLGHLLGQLLTLSWLAGALLTFGSSQEHFRKATLGLWPLRLIVVAVVVVLLDRFWTMHWGAFVFSFLATHVAGVVIEGWALRELSQGAPTPKTDQPDSSPQPIESAEDR